MKYPPEGAPAPDSASLDETLRLIAHVPVPKGLERRVHAAVFHAGLRRGRILAWPVSAAAPAFSAGHNWMRATAAAAIVFVVAGGGWGVYRRAERPAAKVMVMPVAPAVSGGFSSAGAIRTPQTVKGPVVQVAGPAHKQLRKKTLSRHGVSEPRGAAGQGVSAPAASRNGK